jgi:plasmid stabilization system protein ParE
MLAYEDALDKALLDIAAFPGIGKVRDELGVSCRSLRVQQHVIYYRVRDASVRVIRMLHVRVNPADRLGQD